MVRSLDTWSLVIYIYFNIEIKLALKSSECEKVYYKSSIGRTQGTFNSPLFPSAYPTNIDCILYYFIGNEKQIVELIFLEFDLQISSGDRCSDSLRLYVNLEEPEVRRGGEFSHELCGNISIIPKHHFSSGPYLILVFQSDSVQRNNTGFRGRYSFLDKAQFEMTGGSQRWGTKCTFDFQSSVGNRNGQFFSPGYPQNYAANSLCQYIFFGMRQEKVRIVFQNVQLETWNGSCSSSPDSIIVRDGMYSTSPVIARYCNTLNSQSVYSTGENLHLEFISDSVNQRRGFAAVFSFFSPDQAHQKDLEGGHTPRNPETREISEDSKFPDRDDVDKNSAGNLKPGDSPFVPSDYIEKVIPPENASPEYFTNNPGSCDKEFLSVNSKSGELRSPLHPNPYPSDIVCRYKFQGVGRERVQIIFRELDLNYPKDQVKVAHLCDNVDSVTISVTIDGAPQDIGSYCDRDRPPMLMSRDGTLEVTFRSYSPSKATGFRAEYYFVTVCGFTFRSESMPNGSFTSPNFPGFYPRNTECHYLFFGRRNEQLYLTFPYFDVEGLPPRCEDDEADHSDYVELSNFNVQLIDRKMRRLCGTREAQISSSYISDSNFFRVTFKSNDVFDATGFEAFYQFRKIEEIISGNNRQTSGASVVKLNRFLAIIISIISLSTLTLIVTDSLKNLQITSDFMYINFVIGLTCIHLVIKFAILLLEASFLIITPMSFFHKKLAYPVSNYLKKMYLTHAEKTTCNICSINFLLDFGKIM